MKTATREISRATDGSGAYEWKDQHSRKAPKRFTVFVFFASDPAALALDDDALATADGVLEEIDVNAGSEGEARAIGQAALDRDYEDGGRIVEVTERPAGWWYL